MNTIIKRHPENPIVQPGLYDWRAAVVFNPAVERAADGTFYMIERATCSLHPFRSLFGLLKSDDGVHFEHVLDRPVMSAKTLGYPEGNIQDPRLIRMGDTYILTYVLKRMLANCYPLGNAAPKYEGLIPEGVPQELARASRTGIATSKNLIDWEHLGFVGPEDLDDRDNVLFPEKIGSRYAMLRRPMHWVGAEYGCDAPSIWISFSDNLRTWSDAELLASAEYEWEGRKIGASAPPVKTDRGWFVTYHGVDKQMRYCVGALLLDLEDPTKIIARSRQPIMVPETYYERIGLVIPNCLFPTGNVLVDRTLYLYYGVCDTAIALATADIDELIDCIS